MTLYNWLLGAAAVAFSACLFSSTPAIEEIPSEARTPTFTFDAENENIAIRAADKLFSSSRRANGTFRGNMHATKIRVTSGWAPTRARSGVETGREVTAIVLWTSDDRGTCGFETLRLYEPLMQGDYAAVSMTADYAFRGRSGFVDCAQGEAL